MTFLLDANLLIALAWPNHVHHAAAHDWFGSVGRQSWATCPLTQLAFVRISSNPRIIPDGAVSPRSALAALLQIVSRPGHEFWADDVAPAEAGVFSSLVLVGHRQVTDAYLLALCQRHGGVLATLDRGVAELARAIDEPSGLVTVVG
ncbi:MAG TPA: TA system VapC family ribonuclease toxin [Gammaproteobacteria bacterium]|nr:TA system VapC family ribonuclease toxin [Gammaproteobacteria bacterium]